MLLVSKAKYSLIVLRIKQTNRFLLIYLGIVT